MNNSNNNNQGRHYANHEQAFQMFMNGDVRAKPESIQERIDKYGSGTGASKQQQNISYGGNPVSNVQGSHVYGDNYNNQQNITAQDAGYGVQNGYVNAPSQPSYEQLLEAYNNRLPKAYGQPIVAVRKDSRGVIHAFMLQNGQVLDYAQMLQASLDHQLSGLIVQANQEGEPILRSFPDAYSGNNLDHLPSF